MAAAPAEGEPVEEPPAPSEDNPDAEPEIEAVEMLPKLRKPRPRMLSLTLLDGTTISVPATKGKSPSRPDPAPPPSEGDEGGDTLTTRDSISALRAVAHGADASEILGRAPGEVGGDDGHDPRPSPKEGDHLGLGVRGGVPEVLSVSARLSGR